MKILNSIFGFILTILIVFGIVYFTVPAIKEKVDGLFTPPAIEQVEQESQSKVTDTETETETDTETENITEEHDYSNN